MKDYSYTDPYEGVQVFVAIDDDDEEAWETALSWLEQSRKEIQSEDRRQRYHAPYHIEALMYEGAEYVSGEDVAADAVNADEENRIDELLQSNLTAVQYRRFRMYMDGMSIREISRIEDSDYSSVYESIESAKKKLRKVYENADAVISAFIKSKIHGFK